MFISLCRLPLDPSLCGQWRLRPLNFHSHTGNNHKRWQVRWLPKLCLRALIAVLPLESSVMDSPKWRYHRLFWLNWQCSLIFISRVCAAQMRPLLTRAVFQGGCSPAGICSAAGRWSACHGWLRHSSPPGCCSLLCSRAQSLLDGSESSYLCIHDCVVLSKGRIPGTKQYYGAIWIVFYGFSEAFCPLPKMALKLLEALKRYLRIVIDLLLGFKLSVRSAGEHLLQCLFYPKRAGMHRAQRKTKNRFISAPRTTSNRK